MVDKDRILAKIDELDSYINEFIQIAPADFEEYQKIEKKRSCERLLHLVLNVLSILQNYLFLVSDWGYQARKMTSSIRCKRRA